MKPTRGLIDADILVYKYGYAATQRIKFAPEFDVVEHFCLETAKELIRDKIAFIVEDLKLSSYTLFLSCEGKTFRHEIYPEYKAGRPPKPPFVNLLRQWLLKEYSRVIVVSKEGFEADDALGMAQEEEDTVICSIDKDMLQIPGWHYNINSCVLQYINELDATRWLFHQALTGDSVDNYSGAKGIGSAKADALLSGCPQNYTGFYHITLFAFLCVGQTEEDFRLTLKIAHIYRKGENLWSPEGELETSTMDTVLQKILDRIGETKTNDK